MEFRERIEHLKNEWSETGLPEIDIYENVTIPYTKEIDEKGKNQYFVNAQLTGSKRAFYPYIFISPSKIIYITESEQDTSLDLEKSRKYIQTQILYSFLHQFSNEEIEIDSIIGIGYCENDSQSECESNYALIHSENDLIDYLLSRESANAHLHVSEEASIALESLQNRDASSFIDTTVNNEASNATDTQQLNSNDIKQDTDSFDESEDNEDSIYIEIPDKRVEPNRPEGRYVKGPNGKEIYIPPAITSYTEDDDSIYIEDTNEKQNEAVNSREDEPTDEILLDIDAQPKGSDQTQKTTNIDADPEEDSDDVIFFDIDDETKQESKKTSEKQNKEYEPNFILIDDDTKFHYRSDLDDNQTFTQKTSSYKEANSTDSQYYQSNVNNQSANNANTESQDSTESKTQPEDKSTEHLTKEELDAIYKYRTDYRRCEGKFRHYYTQDNRQNNTQTNTQKTQTDQATTRTVQSKKPTKKSRISAGTVIVWGIIICFIISLYYCPFSIRGYGPVIGNDTVETDENDNTALTMNSLAGYWESDGTGTAGNKHLWIELSNNGVGDVTYPIDISEKNYMKKTLPITYNIDGTTINIQTTEEYQNLLNKDLGQNQMWQFSIPVTSIKHDVIKVHVMTADGSNQYDVTFTRISHIKYSINKTYSLK